MDVFQNLSEKNFFDIVAMWIFLYGCFLGLVYYFRENITLEGGLFGFLLPMLYLIPINIIVTLCASFFDLPMPEFLKPVVAPYADIFTIFFMNFLLLIFFSKVIEGMTVTSDKALFLFIGLFSLIAYLLRYFPKIPEFEIEISSSSEQLFEHSFVDMLVRWIVHVVIFLFLTYPFREKITIEGFPGYGMLLIVIVPLNIVAANYAASMDVAESAAPYAHFSIVMIMNVVLMFCFSKFVSGLVISSYLALGLFTLIFSILGTCVRMIPPIEPFSKIFG